MAISEAEQRADFSGPWLKGCMRCQWSICSIQTSICSSWDAAAAAAAEQNQIVMQFLLLQLGHPSILFTGAFIAMKGLGPRRHLSHTNGLIFVRDKVLYWRHVIWGSWLWNVFCLVFLSCSIVLPFNVSSSFSEGDLSRTTAAVLIKNSFPSSIFWSSCQGKNSQFWGRGKLPPPGKTCWFPIE